MLPRPIYADTLISLDSDGVTIDKTVFSFKIMWLKVDGLRAS